MSEIPGTPELSFDMETVRQVITSLVNVWSLMLVMYAQIYFMQMLFGLLHSFMTQIRPPPVGGA